MKIVRCFFWCYYNKLTSLAGTPKKVGGDFWCYGNLVQFNENDVSSVCNVVGRVKLIE